MAVEKFNNANMKYLRIVGGKLREASDEKNPESVRREFTDKKGVTKVYYDLLYKNCSGIIKKVKLRDTNFGEVLDIIFDNEVLTLSLNSRFFSDFMKKIPNADLSKPVMLSPYDFAPEGKRKIGLTVMQEEGKLKNFYYDDETKSIINGFPEPEGETEAYSKDDWKLYFLTVTKFLKNKVKDLENQLDISKNKEGEQATIIDVPEDEEELKIENIPV